MSFDEMVDRARALLFGSGIPDFESKFAKNHSSLDAQAEVWFFLYQNGVCMDCPALIDYANRTDKSAWAGQRLLRTLLGLFDQFDEPITRELRKWSAQSRLENPKRKRGRPRVYWFHNAWTDRAIAALVYETGKNLTRNKASPEDSPCDAVAAAFKKEGVHLAPSTVQSA